MILANIHPYRIVLILILSYPRILCFYINRGIKGSREFFLRIRKMEQYKVQGNVGIGKR